MLVSTDAAPDAAPASTLDFNPVPRVGAPEGVSPEVAGDAAPAQPATEILQFTFEKAGSLGIEFVQQEPPYVVEQVHAGGSAYGIGIQRTDRLIEVAGQSVETADWDNTLKPLLTQRPVTVKFLRDPAAIAAVQNGGGAALLSGFAGRMRSFGGSVAQQGLGFGTAVGSMAGNVAQQGLGSVTNKVTQQGLGLGGLGSAVGNMAGSVAQQGLGGLGNSVGNTVGSLGSDLGSKVGSAAQTGLGLGGKVGSTMGGMTSSLYSGLLDTLKDINDDGPIIQTPGLDDSGASILPGAGKPATSAQALHQQAPEETGPAPRAESKVPEVAPAGGMPEVQHFSLAEESDHESECVGARATNVAQVDSLRHQHEGELAQRDEKIKALEDALREVESKRDAERSSGEAVKATLEEKELQLSKLERDLSAMRAESGSHSAAAAARDSQIAELQSKLLASEKTAQDLQTTLSNAERKLAEGSASQSHEQEANTRLQEQLQAAQAELANVANLQGQVAQLQASLAAKDAELQQCAALKSQVEQLQSSLASKDAEVQNGAQAQGELQQLKAALAAKDAELQQQLPLKQQVEQLQASLAAKDTELQQRSQDTGHVEQLQTSMAAKDAQLQQYEQLKGHVAQLQSALAAKDVELQQHAQFKGQVESLQSSLAAKDAELQQSAHLQSQLEQYHKAVTERDAQLQAYVTAHQQAQQAQQQMQAHVVQLSAQAQESNELKGHVEQLRFACTEKDKQLQDKIEILGRKDDEIKNLIRQLAAVGDMAPQAVSAAQEAETSTTFDVMFALDGPLGIEFERQTAPYIVAKVHPGKVASGLGIQPSDELIALGDANVTEAPWEAIVPLVSKRPVFAKFRRPAPAASSNGNEAGQDRGMLSSVSNLGTSLLSKAITKGASTPANAAAVTEATERLQAEVERLGTLLRARDEELEECGNRLKQRDEALRVLQAGDTAAVEAATLAQDKEALTQRVDQLHSRCEQMEQQLKEACSQRDEMNSRVAEEVRQKEEYRQQAVALTERSNSLMKQFEDLRNTCQHLTLDAQQKGALEGQVAELARMNAQWQQAHSNLNADAENLRQQTADMQILQSEVVQLRSYAQAYDNVVRRLQEADAQLEASQQQMLQVQQERLADQNTIQRLQAAMDSMHEDGESQAGLLESELLERTREAAALRRETEEQRRRLQELIDQQADMREAAEAGRSLRSENAELRSSLDKVEQEKESLNGVIERCVEKFEKDSRERPHLVDKRMVTQMMAAYLEQRDNPREQQEIAARMADLLGFTSAEREQCGLRDGRKRLKAPGEDGVEDLTNAFVDFLLEESES